MVGNVPGSGHFARGTLCALIGLIFISAYYRRAWGRLSAGPEPSLAPGTPVSPSNQAWPELRYLQWGSFLSVVFLMLAGAADAENDWLDRLVGGLMGIVAALFVGMFGVGFVAMANLWKEIVLQLKKAKIGSLVLSIPMAILWLALGLGVMILSGMLAEKVPKSLEFLLRGLLWFLIAAAFYGLWKGRSHAALLLRLILIVSFSAIIAAAVAFGFWWISSETAPLLVVLLSAMISLNVFFYSRWVRAAALKDNLVDESDCCGEVSCRKRRRLPW